jgi:hypothetical protein
MNTALLVPGTASGTASVGPLGHPPLVARLIRGAAAALPRWGRRARSLDRDDAILMYRLQQDAARLREEQFRQGTFARLM